MTAVRIGRVRGIDLIADASVVLVAGLAGLALYVDLTITSPGVATSKAILIGVVFGLAFVGSIVAHELSHSLVALRLGMVVRRIRLFVFGGYSVIESKGLNPRNEVLTAVAGPAVSGVIALILWLVGLVGVDVEVDRVLFALAIVNGAVAVFNLLPGFPLDGGRVVRAALWKRTGDRVHATRRAAMWGRILGMGVIVVGAIMVLWFRDLGGAVWALVGWFLYRTALEAGRREVVVARMDGLVVGDVMRDVGEAVPGSMTVSRVLEQYQYGSHLRTMPVEVGDRVVGIVGEPEIDGMSSGRRAAARASSAMTGIGPTTVVEASMPLDVYLAGHGSHQDRVVVVSEGRVVGIVDGLELKHLLEAASGVLA